MVDDIGSVLDDVLCMKKPAERTETGQISTISMPLGTTTMMIKVDITCLADGRKFAKAMAWFPEARQANTTKRNRPKPQKKLMDIEIEEEEVY